MAEELVRGFFPIAVAAGAGAGGGELLRAAAGPGGLAGRPGAFTADEVEGYMAAMREPGALTAAINYYRANVRRDALGAGAVGAGRRGGAGRVGERVRRWGWAAGRARAVRPRVRVHRIADAGHWVHREAAAEVNRVMVEFLTNGAGAMNGEAFQGRAAALAEHGPRAGRLNGGASLKQCLSGRGRWSCSCAG